MFFGGGGESRTLRPCSEINTLECYWQKLGKPSWYHRIEALKRKQHLTPARDKKNQ